jgi:asparagine synthase (glutamine-hydrolysing)
MCGICGIVGHPDKHLVARMLDAIRHRGPDSFDVTATPHGAFGGCRLAIVGDHATTLPFWEGDTGSTVLFNGEIYNYREIAKLLELAAVNEADAESHVLARVLDRYGPEGVGRLKGMFAFAVCRNERLILGRDRLGIKPMFYTLIGADVLFGSEIKALLRHPGCSVALDEEVLDEIAVFGYIASKTRTAFSGIRQVPPGCVVCFEQGAGVVQRYWTPPVAFHAAREPDLHELSTELFQVLRTSCEQVLRHDRHQKAFYLSGGVDSSLLASLAADLTSGPLKTLTLADAGDSPDLLAARSVANAIGSDHSEIRVGLEDYLRELPLFVRHYESPIAGGAFDLHGGMAFQILSRRVSECARVTCSGEGADELFGGYYWLYTHPLGFSDRVRDRLRAIGSPSSAARRVETLFPKPEDARTYQRNLFDFLLGGGLANYHLWSVDRSSGAFGFEVRPPYLHDDVVELALSLPIQVKVNGTETKRVLRAAAEPLFSRLGIASCLTRPKDAMPGALRNVVPQFDLLSCDLVPRNHLDHHPYRQYVHTPSACVLFDLFFYILVANRGDLPTGFDLTAFYRDGTCEDLYR